jgi:hypothetical protein
VSSPPPRPPQTFEPEDGQSGAPPAMVRLAPAAGLVAVGLACWLRQTPPPRPCGGRVFAGFRLVRLTAAQQAGVSCLVCGRVFGAFDTSRPVRHRPGARRCAPGCVLDTVAATAHLFRALAPAAHLRSLPASPRPHAAAARVLVLVEDRRVITPAIPAASAAAGAAQARRLGLEALIEPAYPFRRSAL